MKDSLMHVAITDRVNSRRLILEGVVATIRCLKNFERLKVIRKQKKVYKTQLFNNINEINNLFSTVNMPKIDYEKKNTVEMKQSVTKESITKQKKLVETPQNKELDKLERDIQDLQKKISSL